jgi:hypothetical protein
VVTLVPWGDGLPERFEPYPSFDWHLPEHTRSVRAPVPIRLDGAGGVHVLSGGDAILHLDSRTSTPIPAFARIADFACEAAGACMVLDDAGRVHGLDPDGTRRWEQAVGASRLLFDGDRLLAAVTGGVIALDPATGVPGSRLAFPGPAFLGGRTLLAVTYDEERNRRGIVARRLDGEAVTELAGRLEHYAWLVHPFGADDRARLYVWQDGRVAAIGLDGAIEPLAELTGIAIRGEDVLTSRPAAAGGGIVVEGPGVEITLAAPSDARLIYADERYHLLGGEAPDSAGELRIYSAAGELESSGPPPENLADADCRLPDHTAWQVSATGEIVIPLPTPEGLAIVRLDHRR